MKKLIALFMCIAIIFALTGCKKKSIDEIEQKISQQLTDAEYIDAHISGKVSMNIPDAGMQTLTIDADYKMDISGNFPKMLLDGSFGLEGVMSIPLSLYLDENSASISMLGQVQETTINDEAKTQLQTILGKDGIQTNFSKTVTETTYNDTRAIQLTYDVSAINQLASLSAQASLDNLTSYYLLNNKDELDSMVVLLSITSEGEKMDMEFTIKYNSLNQPITITPISTGTTRNIPLLTNEQTS